MTRRLPGLAIAAVLQLAALALAHELVFVVRYGSRYGEELVHSGHGEAWNAAVLTSAALALGLAAIAFARLARLGILVRRHRPASPGGGGGGLEPLLLLRTWLRVAPRVAILSVLFLTIQENIERGAIGQQMPGPGVLVSAEYPGALWITIAVALAVSLVAALVEWRGKVLFARLRRAHQPLPRVSSGATRRPASAYTRPIESLLGRRSALRAPPQASVAA